MFSFLQKAPIDKDIMVWVLDAYGWISRTVGPVSWKEALPLILPTTTYFPILDKKLESHEKAQWLFDRVRHQIGMEHWQCELEVLEEDIDVKVSDVMYLANVPVNPLGTFSVDEKDDKCIATIRYNSSELSQPMNLVATFAHELSHYLLHAQSFSLPEEIVEEEMLTDLTAVFCGYGVCMANSAFISESNMDGSWRIGNKGYMTTQTICFSTALFCHVNNIDIELARQYLKVENFTLFKKSYEYLKNNSDIIDEIKYIYP